MPALTLSRAAAVVAAGVLLVLPATAGADVGGRVLSDSDHPVAGATVTWTATGSGATEAITNADGRFFLAGVEPPGTLAIEHPFFVTRQVRLEAATADLIVRLATRPELFEEVEVAGRRGGDRKAPVGVSSAVVRPEDSAAPPSSLSEMVTAVPGVSENGQGGLFQVVSIRGCLLYTSDAADDSSVV